MPDDHKQGYRLRLGPIVCDLLDGLDEQTPAALDTEVQRLLSSQKKLDSLHQERADLAQSVLSLAGHVGNMSSALTTSSTSIDNLSHMVDHRTREIQKLMLHISTLVGTTMTEGAERERLHTRMNEIFHDLGKQMEALSKLVKEQQRIRQRQVQSATARADEESLSIADQVMRTLDMKPEKSRGMER